MSFIRVRKGRYVYRETRFREGKRVRSHSEYLGIVGGYSCFQEEQDRHYDSAVREAGNVDAYQRAEFGETGQEKADREAKESAFNAESFLGDTAEEAEDSQE